MSYLYSTRPNQWSRASLGMRNVASLALHPLFRFSLTRCVGIGLTIFVCTCSFWINAQQSEESAQVADECDIEIAPIDRQQLAADPEKTKARVIALMLQDMDRCIGARSSRIANAQQGSAQGGTPGSAQPQNGSQPSHAGPTISSTQTQTHASQASVESTTADTDSTDTPSVETVDSTVADILRDTSNSPTSTQHNTNVFDFGSDDELVLDDYAKTLHEAYLAETDPVLKEALGEELTNYLNNKKR